MLGTKLAYSMNNLSDEMIEEAIYATKKSSISLIKRWLMPVACLCVILIFALGTIADVNVTPSPNDNENMYSLTEQEVRTSAYSSFCPEYRELGCELTDAAIYGEDTFKALFSSSNSEITIIVKPIHSAGSYDDRLVDLDLAESECKYQNENPVFRDDQFSIESQDYVKVNTTSTGKVILKFAVVTDYYFVEYVIKSDSHEWIAQAFENISRCYKEN